MRFSDWLVRPLLLIVVLLFAAPVWAQDIGARAGVSLDPDQFYIGLHYETPQVADRVHFRPNIELGIGNDLTVAALNFDLVYRFPSTNPWSLYAGGGPALNIIDTPRDTGAEGGFTLLIGMTHRDGLFFEVKAGMLDSPDFKLGAGYAMRWR